MKIEEFKKALIIELTKFLKKNAGPFSEVEISVFDLGCFPWHGSLELSFLTSDEDKNYGDIKFEEIADWKYYAFNRNILCPEIEDLADKMGREYELSDSKKESGAFLIKACAEVLISEEVKSALKQYRLSPDFICTVFHPDDNNFKNLCDEFTH